MFCFIKLCGAETTAAFHEYHRAHPFPQYLIYYTAAIWRCQWFKSYQAEYRINNMLYFSA